MTVMACDDSLKEIRGLPVSNAVDSLSALVEALKSGDEDATRALISPDFVIHLDGGMPYGGTYYGPDGFLKLTATVFTAWGGSDFEPQYQLTDETGSRVCTVVRFTGRPEGSSETLETMLSEIWEFRNGRAVEARVWYFDTDRLSKAITVAT
jgi:ketosteroid isomerase-like protein